MDQRRVHYLFAALSFLIALITYGFTMQPTVPFWDCGEFAAAAVSLGIPHPPGAPLWTIVGRLGMLIPIFTDPAARYNFLSVLSSATSIMLLYLTIVRLIKIWRGTPRTMADMLTHYGGAFVGALAYCFTDSFWFNALECEVYAFGSLFISLVPWLILVWYDHADEPHSEKYLMLIAYVIGLSLGVHQLALLTIFPVWMLVYYKRWRKTTILGWFLMVATSVAAFAFIFLVVLSDLVDWAGNGKGIISVLILAGMIGGIIYSEVKKKPFLNLGLWGSMFILLGFTTYAVIMVRAAQDPPMNQHHPSNFKALSEYINREQYGEAKEMPRRLEEQNRDHSHDATFNNYTSDWDFFWRYQTGHMFTRYLGWNYVGRESDEQDAGVDWKKTLGLPLILGLFGLFWHFKRDPKRALTLVGTFIIMGFVTAWYQNQQDPQPRERDYFYVGAFYVYAMWIGIGATGILEWLRTRFGSRTLTEASTIANSSDSVPIIHGEGNVGVLLAALGLLLIISPINQCVGLAGIALGESPHDASKWGEYSRWHNYVPYEYAYNFLQSCEPDAILFTAGDNDTFPLWCLQDVYGVRRDVRIVNLSLGNMSWYIEQLKKPFWGVGKPINLPSFTEEKMAIPDEHEGGLQAFGGPAQQFSFDVKPETMKKFTGVAAPGTMSWKFTGQMANEGGYVFTIADQLIKDIVQFNLDTRPIYFATLVPPSYMAGLDSHLSYEGMAARVVPMPQEGNSRTMEVAVNEPLYRQFAFSIAPKQFETPNRAMILNTYRDPESNLSAMDERYAQTYYYMYFRLADYYLRNNRIQDARTTMDTCEKRVPPEKLHAQYRYADLFAERYQQVGDSAKATKYAKMAVQAMRESSADNSADAEQNNVSQMYHLGEVFFHTGQLDSARALFQQLFNQVQGQDKAIMQYKLLAIDARLLQKKGDKRGEYEKLNQIVTQFSSIGGSAYGTEYPQLASRYQQLKAELGIKDTVSAQPALPDTGIKPKAPPMKMKVTQGANK